MIAFLCKLCVTDITCGGNSVQPVWFVVNAYD